MTPRRLLLLAFAGFVVSGVTTSVYPRFVAAGAADGTLLVLQGLGVLAFAGLLAGLLGALIVKIVR